MEESNNGEGENLTLFERWMYSRVHWWKIESIILYIRRIKQTTIKAWIAEHINYYLYEIYLKEYYLLYIYIYYIYISEMSFSDTSSESEINQEEYIKQT